MAPMFSRPYRHLSEQEIEGGLLGERGRELSQRPQTDYTKDPVRNKFQCTHCQQRYPSETNVRRHIGFYNGQPSCRVMIQRNEISKMLQRSTRSLNAEDTPHAATPGPSLLANTCEDQLRGYKFLRTCGITGNAIYSCCHCPTIPTEFLTTKSAAAHVRHNHPQHPKEQQGGADRVEDGDDVLVEEQQEMDLADHDGYNDDNQLAEDAPADEDVEEQGFFNHQQGDAPAELLGAADGFIPALIRSHGVDAYAKEITAFMEKVYGPGAMEATTFDLFLRACRAHAFEPSEQLRIELLELNDMVSVRITLRSLC